MAYSRCESCMGRKTVSSLGGMTKQCSYCKGVGYITLPVSSDTVVRVKRKYTRPVKADVELSKIEA